MIPSIGHGAAPPSFRVPSDSPSTEAASSNAVTTGAASSRRSNVCSFSKAESLPTSDGYYQRTSLKVRAHSQVRTAGNGDVLTTSKARLRFSYDFEAADGTKIRVRVQANVNYAQLSADDEQAQSMRLRVTAKVSILQKNVASGLSPLLDTGENASVLSQALELFQQVTEAATSAFLGSDPLDGDSLISGLVGAFNGLAETMDGLFLPALSASEVETPSQPDPILEPPVAEPAPVETAPPAERPPQDSLSPGDPVETTPVENAGQSESPVSETATPPVDGEPEAIEPEIVEPAPREPAVPSARSVMLKLRLQVVQSLNSLVQEFGSGSSGLFVSHSSLRASAQLALRYDSNGLAVSDALLQARQIDAQV